MDHIKFLKRIGALGGAKRKTDPRRSNFARAAALKRWQGHHVFGPGGFCVYCRLDKAECAQEKCKAVKLPDIQG